MMARPPRTRFWLLVTIGLCLVVVALMLGSLRPSQSGPLLAVRDALAQGNTQDALSLVKTAAEQDPGSAEIAFLKARCHRRLAQLPEFRRVLTLAANLGFPSDLLEREQTLLLVQQGQLGVASPEVAALLAAPGDDTPEIYEAVVRGCLLTSHLTEADLFLDGWLADFPDAPLPWFYRGLLLETARRWSEAAAAFEQAIAEGVAPESEACRHLADVLRQHHQYSEALRVYAQCDASTAAVLQGQAACLEALQDIDAARDVYREMLERFPDEPAALAGAGRLAAKRGEHASAKDLLERAVERSPSDVQAWRSLAWSLVNLGETERAREAFRNAVRLTEQIQRADNLLRRIDEEPENVRYRLELAELMRAAGRPQDARLWFSSVLQIDPDNAQARAALDAIPPSSAAAETPAASYNAGVSAGQSGLRQLWE